ncbi:unnamed protein product [Parajaminaea phylloscopi]
MEPQQYSTAETDGQTVPALAQLVLDTVQLPIAHLLNIIPPHLLDASHETLSATSLAMPVTTIEALLDTFRSINWICDAIAQKKKKKGPCPDTQPLEAPSEVDPREDSIASEDATPPTTPPAEPEPALGGSANGASSDTPKNHVEEEGSSQVVSNNLFDLSELMQRASDVVSGQASDKGIELVLSETMLSEGAPSGGSVAPIRASGDEGAVKCLLAHTLARLIEDLSRGSSIRLSVNTQEEEMAFDMVILLSSGGFEDDAPRVEVEQAALELARARFGITKIDTGLMHARLSFAGLARASGVEVRDSDARIARREPYEKQRFLPRLALAEEPSIADLGQFGQQHLNGRRIALHASPRSQFATALTHMLSEFGCEVQILPLAKDDVESFNSAVRQDPDGAAAENQPMIKTAIALTDGRPGFVRYQSDLMRTAAVSSAGEGHVNQAILDPVTGVPLTLSLSSEVESSAEGVNGEALSHQMTRQMSRDSAQSATTLRPRSAGAQMEPFSFLMVDDDMETLQRQLLRMRSALPLLRNALGDDSPTAPVDLGADGSSAQGNSLPVAASSGAGPSPHSTTHAIIFFTTLANYRSVRDVVQPLMESAVQALGQGSHSGAAAAMMPEIVVIPKPAGFRRVLTALQTAVLKPPVDPFFAPIATSPLSPHLWEARMASSRSASATQSNAQTPAPSTIANPAFAQHPTPATPPAGGQQSPKSPMRTSPRSNRTPMRLPNFPRHDHAAAAFSALPTPLRHEISGMASSSSGPASPQHDPPPASPFLGAPKQATSGGPSPAPSPALLPTPAVSLRSSQGGSSPMPVEALEYFSETASRLGSGGGASGTMISTIDGRPAGILFQPKSKAATGSQGSVSSVSGANSSRVAVNHSDPEGALARGIDSASQGRGSQHTSVKSHRASREPGSLPSPLAMQPRPLSDLLETELGDPEPAGDLAPPAAPSRQHSSTSSHGSSKSGRRSDEKLALSPRSGAIFSPQGRLSEILASNEPPLLAAMDEIQSPAPALAASVEPHSEEQRANASQEASEVKPTSQNAGFAVATSASGAPRDAQESTGPSAASQQGATQGEAIPDLPAAPASRELEEPAAAVSSAQSALPGALQGTGARPSAQPQSGLLIGAGFAPTARRGGAPRRTALREKVLPPIKVLIVEDNPINLRILKQFMTRKRIKFETAVNGKEAVEKWAAGGFHLILMDIQLPVMDGIEATTEIRKQEGEANVGVLPANSPLNPPAATGGRLEDVATSSTPTPSSASTDVPAAMPAPFQASVIIVALTASSLNSDRVAALAAGCNDFLQKPVNLVWLEKKIIEWGSMQYILLSGAGVFDAERRAARLVAKAGHESMAGGRGAMSAAAMSSDVRRAFGQAPNVQARRLADRLHLPAGGAHKKRSEPPVASPVPGVGAGAGAGTRGIAVDVGAGTLPQAEARQMEQENDQLRQDIEKERTKAADVALELGQAPEQL